MTTTTILSTLQKGGISDLACCNVYCIVPGKVLRPEVECNAQRHNEGGVSGIHDCGKAGPERGPSGERVNCVMVVFLPVLPFPPAHRDRSKSSWRE